MNTTIYRAIIIQHKPQNFVKKILKYYKNDSLCDYNLGI